SSLLARTIAPVAGSVIASPAYLEKQGTPRHPLDLGRHRLIGYGHRERAMPLRFHRDGEEATVIPTGPLFTNNGDIMIPLLIAGGGIAVLPDFIAEEALVKGESSASSPTGRCRNPIFTFFRHHRGCARRGSRRCRTIWSTRSSAPAPVRMRSI
ncbi:MAG: LysR substrate-binding domain-containing protein, partial [Sphingopyxis sp.]